MYLTLPIAAVLLLFANTISAQTDMSLQEAGRRQPPSFAPAHAGARVKLQGTVVAEPVRILDYTHVVIEDQDGYGFTLEWTHESAAQLHSGDVVRTTGVITHRSGLPVLHPESVEKMGGSPAQEPIRLTTADLNGFRYLGRYVEVEAYVLSSSQNAGGDVLLTGERNSNVAIFLPRNNRPTGTGLRQFQPGDKVRVRGISSQYCPVEPYDRGFQIVVPDAAAVNTLHPGWVIAPDVLIYALAGLLAVLGIWWIRERQAAAHRRVMRRMTALSEELLTAPSGVELARKLEVAFPPLLGPASVSLYVFNRGAKTLERVTTERQPERHSIEVDAPMGTLAAAAALCFRNRALLEIPNARKSPLINTPVESHDPQGALFVPLFAQTEPVGVLAVHYQRPVPRLSVDQRTAMQHLGNLIAASLRLQEQRWMRDQLLRSEKMAAAGQLISGVANDLREPLSIISDLARQALDAEAPGRSTIHQIDEAARHGVEIVQHLLAFARMEKIEPRPLDIFGLVSSIVEMRQVECALKSVRLESALPVSPVQIVGDQAQLEQVFLSLLLHAEQTAATSEARQVSVVGRLVGKRVIIGISYSGPSNGSHAGAEQETEVFDARVCQALIQGHAGDLRLNPDGAINKAEVDLPVYQPTTIGFDQTPVPARKAARTLTVLLVESDPSLQRRLLTYLTVRDHRVIPLETFDAALEVIQQFRFDLVISADRIGDASWVDFFQRVRRKTGAFVLLTEVEQVESGPTFKSGEAFVLRKPVDEIELDNLLKVVESTEVLRR